MALSAGLSDFHKMIITIIKCTFPKAKPKEIIYRNYKNFHEESFKSELRNILRDSEIFVYKPFEDVFLSVL